MKRNVTEGGMRRRAGMAAVWLGGAALGFSLAGARADSLVVQTSPNLVIPDGNASGTQSLLDVPVGSGVVTDVNLRLTIAGTGSGGGWNGDLYLLLTHAGSASYVLNRPGKSAGNLLGYGDDGFLNIVFDDEASGDAHVYQQALGMPGDSGLPVAGSLQPDGRSRDPLLVTESDPRNFMLDVFDGRPAEGPWRLLLFDLSPGGTFSLVDWGLELTTQPGSVTIPETGRGIVLAGATVAGLAGWRWARRRAAGGTASGSV